MRLKIAYLDDEADLCETFRDNLESEGVTIWTSSDPEEFIRELPQVRPDLAFLDYRLPHTNGDIVAGRLDPALPKVMLTGDFDVQPKAHFIRIFHKPFSFDELESFIHEFAAQRT